MVYCVGWHYYCLASQEFAYCFLHEEFAHVDVHCAQDIVQKVDISVGVQSASQAHTGFLPS